jgi:hypothetical protein
LAKSLVVHFICARYGYTIFLLLLAEDSKVQCRIRRT